MISSCWLTTVRVINVQNNKNFHVLLGEENISNIFDLVYLAVTSQALGPFVLLQSPSRLSSSLRLGLEK